MQIVTDFPNSLLLVKVNIFPTKSLHSIHFSLRRRIIYMHVKASPEFHVHCYDYNTPYTILVILVASTHNASLPSPAYWPSTFNTLLYAISEAHSTALIHLHLPFSLHLLYHIDMNHIPTLMITLKFILLSTFLILFMLLPLNSILPLKWQFPA